MGSIRLAGLIGGSREEARDKVYDEGGFSNLKNQMARRHLARQTCF
jgi:hypothetical protein